MVSRLEPGDEVTLKKDYGQLHPVRAYKISIVTGDIVCLDDGNWYHKNELAFVPPEKCKEEAGCLDDGDDLITRPPHYTRFKIEPLTFIMANDLPFWLGNVIKYCCRYDAKDGLHDLKKARQYLDTKINELEKEQ